MIKLKEQMPMDYHRRPETGNGDLSFFGRIGARRYQYEKQRMEEDKEYARLKTKSLKKGGAFHTKLLEPDIFDANYIPMDVEVPSSPQMKQFFHDYIQLMINPLDDATEDDMIIAAISSNYVEKDREKSLARGHGLLSKYELYCDYLQLEDSEAIVLTPTEHKEILGASEAVLSDPLLAPYFGDYFSNGESYNELEIYWEVEWCPSIKLKSKLDRVLINVEENKVIYIDPKTTESAHEKSFLYSIKKYKYHKQMSFYESALQNWLFEKYGKVFNIEMALLAIELKLPHERNLFMMSRGILDEGKELWEEQLRQLSWHVENDIWINRTFHERGHILVEPETKEENEESEIKV